MRWIFLAPFVVLSSFCLGQVPGYVPQDGLVAWYPFDGNANDESGNGNDGDNLGAVPVVDRNGETNSAYGFGGDAKIHLQSLESIDWGYSPLTVSAWAHHEGQSDWNAVIVRYDDCISSYVWGMTLQDEGNGLVCHDHNRFQTNHDIVVNPFTPSGWTHYVFVKDPDNGVNKVYVNGELLETVSFASPFSPSGEGSPQLYVGSCGGWAHGFVGSIDDVAFFDRTLTDDEIEILYNGIPPVLGCTNLQACNFNELADEDDGSCEFVSCHCLDGTVWSEELGGCIPAATCPQDLDFDGVVGVNDLMNLLSAFGTPCDPPVAEWICGDPVSYHGYEYETVLIGEQCWFAENLRTELYQNGDSIPRAESAIDWIDFSEGSIGGFATYGSFNDVGCADASPQINSCDPLESIAYYGLYYNFHTISDERLLCPSGWSIGDANEWADLFSFTQTSTGSGYWSRHLRAEGSWYVSFEWNEGTNSTGFTAHPGGAISLEGMNNGAGANSWWWTSSPSANGEEGKSSYIFQNSMGTDIWDYSMGHGFPVRCIKD